MSTKLALLVVSVFLWYIYWLKYIRLLGWWSLWKKEAEDIILAIRHTIGAIFI